MLVILTNRLLFIATKSSTYFSLKCEKFINLTHSNNKMCRRLFFLCSIFISVLSQEVTFQNAQIEYQTEFYEVYSVDIESANSLKESLPDIEISRITVTGNSVIPVIHKDAISDLTHLKILQIRQHGLEDIQAGAFRNVPRLEVIRLNGNKLKEIKSGVFNNLNLIFLSLDQNVIVKISPQAFDHLPKLQVLDLSINKLKHFDPDWLKDKPSLTSVSLTYNEIQHLPDGALANYHNDIDFSNNRITNVSNGIFGNDKRVGQLWLSDNYIEKWDENFVKDVKIRVLDVSRNKLECLDGNFEHFFVAFQTRIDGNPWKCECLVKVAEWATQRHTRVKMTHSARNCNITSL